ncbi:transcription termination/antitermination protein NusG [Granulicella arctica]|uniref:Transcription antitermination factor NusG n=1 Tax=Granulicella arctica TaxID=940613 RepID=A0A7Y9PIW6_9BACT|nr:transcription termination/antitermination NusG family protein [Granulicella arctica]NYF79923.1 transcription antitermination factor NusG [Granulicella arctica]
MHCMTTMESGAETGFYAVKVRAAGETTVAGMLRQKGLNVLLPIVEERRRYSDRMKRANRALFPGYVFVRVEDGELLPLVSTRGVSYMVKTGRELAPLSADDLATIEALCQETTGCELCDQLSVGQRVVIETGPLSGLVGVLTQSGERSRVVLSVNSIFQSVSVDVRDTRVRAIQ